LLLINVFLAIADLRFLIGNFDKDIGMIGKCKLLTAITIKS